MDLQVYRNNSETPILFLISDIFASLNDRIKNIYEDIYNKIRYNDEKLDLMEKEELRVRNVKRDIYNIQKSRVKQTRNKKTTQKKFIKKRFKKILRTRRFLLNNPPPDDLFGEVFEKPSPIQYITSNNDKLHVDRSLILFNESAVKIIEVLITYAGEFDYGLQFRTPQILAGEYTNLPRITDSHFFLENADFIYEITRYITGLIYKGNLHGLLIKNHETLLTFDYYKNRRIGALPRFHQDNNGNSEYLTLSYESHTIGPEIIAAEISVKETPRNLRLRVKETIGMDNRLFVHSTPVPTSNIRTNTVPISFSKYSCENFTCSSRLSPGRASKILNTARNYLRGCWEKYDEKHGAFKSEFTIINVTENYECEKYTSQCICVNGIIGELFGIRTDLQAGGN